MMQPRDNSDFAWLVVADWMDDNGIIGADCLRNDIINGTVIPWDYEWNDGSYGGVGSIGGGGVGSVVGGGGVGSVVGGGGGGVGSVGSGVGSVVGGVGGVGGVVGGGVVTDS